MKVLLVIDMLKDFIYKNGALYCGKKVNKIIPFIKRKIDEFHKNKWTIIFICDSHKKSDLEFKMFPKHCIENTKGADVIDELPVLPNDIKIKKTRYSGFYGTNLDKILKKLKPEIVEVVGVCTSICVMDTVGDLRNRDYSVIVLKKGVADFDPKGHGFALLRMKKIYGAKVI